MKKQYMEPSMMVIELQSPQQILSGSPDITLQLVDDEKNVTEEEIW